MRFLVLLALALALPVCACGPSTKPAADGTTVQIHATEGTIESISPNGRVLHIAHEEIPGYMLAMTMPFEASSAAVIKGLKAGDRVVFEFEEREDGRRVIVRCTKK
ncbi:MAG: copper-binding protein [Myxococcales bacterium]|nr:copper-binding protein [Myxococcales bacterium]